MFQIREEKIITIIATQVLFCDMSDMVKTYNYVVMLIPWSGLFTELDIAKSFVTCISACHTNACHKQDFEEEHIHIIYL